MLCGKPPVPRIAQLSKLTGDVSILIDVGAAGAVTSIRPVNHSQPILLAAVTQHLKTCTFAPARKDGAAVPYRYALTVRFQ